MISIPYSLHLAVGSLGRIPTVGCCSAPQCVQKKQQSFPPEMRSEAVVYPMMIVTKSHRKFVLNSMCAPGYWPVELAIDLLNSVCAS